MKMRSLPKSRALLFVMLLPVLLQSCAHEASPDQAPASEWIDLCPGGSLDDWVRRGGTGSFTFEKDVIVGVIPSGTPSTFLCTRREYSDFLLELECRIDPPMNSGIQIRSHAREKDGRVYGYQVELDPSERAWTAGIYDEARRGWLFDLKNHPAARQAFKPGAWNHLRIRAQGPSIRTWINGVPAADLRDDEDSSGFIALQLHGHRNVGPQVVRWRKLRLKILD